MNQQLYLSLDSVLAFRALYEQDNPSLSALALLAEWSGVSGINLTARKDIMPIFMKTLERLKEELTVRVNAQLTPELDIRRIAFELQPDRITLVPPRWVGPSIVGGLDTYHLQDELRGHITQLHEADIEIALQVEPKLDMIKRLQRLDVDVIILSTHALLSSSRGEARRSHFSQLMDAAVLAARLGMKVGVNGGIDLNAAEQLSRVRQISEVHVGQSLTARAMIRGVEQAIRDFSVVLERGRQSLL